MNENDIITAHAAELVVELINATAAEGGPKWRKLIERKMRRLLESIKREPKTMILDAGGHCFETFRGGIRITTDENEVALLDATSTARLARWLNGHEHC